MKTQLECIIIAQNSNQILKMERTISCLLPGDTAFVEQIHALKRLSTLDYHFAGLDFN
jgi:hypothetical protein